MLPLKSLSLVWKGIVGNFGYHIKMYKFYRIPFKSVFNSLKSATVISALYSPIIHHLQQVVESISGA